jgi:hypothetical protein
VPFRNVFTEATEFLFVVDSPQFILAKPSEAVPAKSPKGIALKFEADPKNPTATVNAKLLVSSKNKPHLPPWVFYLRGGPPPTVA